MFPYRRTGYSAVPNKRAGTINATMTCHVIVAFIYHKNSRFKKVPIGLTRSVYHQTSSLDELSCDDVIYGWSLSNLKKHTRLIHEGIKDYKCELCGKEFAKKESLKNHTKNVHEGAKDIEKTSMAKDHNNAIHDEKKVVSCDICGKTFSRPDSLKIHIRAVHEEIKNLKNHKCESCDKCFSTLSKLLSHIKVIHEGIKEHKCELCEREFGRKESLKVCVTSWTRISTFLTSGLGNLIILISHSVQN